MLERYLRDAPNDDRLIRTGAVTTDGLLSLRNLQDLVYRSDDSGRLTEIFAGLKFLQEGRTACLAQPASIQSAAAGEVPLELIDVTVERTDAGYDRNWTGFHRRRWNHDAHFYEDFVRDAVAKAYGPKESERVLRMDTPGRQRKLIRALALRIWNSDFENYSRFSNEGLRFKAGDETVRNIAADAGGICTEKVQALKFLTDHDRLESEYLLGGPNAPGPFPADRLREMLNTFDFRFAQRHMRYWQHAALLYWVDGEPLLVDATNGNIPFLFLQGDAAQRLLRDDAAGNRPSVPVQMVAETEDYYYHRVEQDIPQNLFFALEGWLDDADLVQVFENELGLYLSERHYVMPLLYRSDREFRRSQQRYEELCLNAGFRVDVSADWNLDGPVGQELAAVNPALAARLLAAEDRLVARYDWWDCPGHRSGLAVIALKPSAGTSLEGRSP
ncbi:MAG: hypothetical protein J4G13_02495 [Dehalococcoidia bacterium]|nr:hypothetical protein [Dehalococcoidia bacterium]